MNFKASAAGVALRIEVGLRLFCDPVSIPMLDDLIGRELGGHQMPRKDVGLSSTKANAQGRILGRILYCYIMLQNETTWNT